MNWLDILIVLIIGFFAVTAFLAGLIREVVTLLSAVVGVVIAGLFYEELAADVFVFIEDDDGARIVSFLVLLGSVYLAGQLTAIMLKQLAAILLLGWVDRAGGAAFGVLKGVVVVEALLIAFVAYPQLGLQEDIRGSALAEFFLDIIPFVLLFLPGEFKDAVNAFFP